MRPHLLGGGRKGVAGRRVIRVFLGCGDLETGVDFEDEQSLPRLYAPLHSGNEGDEDFCRAVCAGAHRVLELGCGSGRILAALSDQVTELFGVDSSEATPLPSLEGAFLHRSSFG